AKKNAVANNISNVEFIAGDVKEEVSKLSDNPELIILDPPRAGINPKALKDIIDFNAREILYISCNPKMLVQDLIILKESGYEIKNVKGVDMFPNSYHCETICYLSLK
ncbi:MAG: 23S rRNA (uracil-5-)-methyltransferase RumA, partial [Peptoanaerobacter stomatis]